MKELDSTEIPYSLRVVNGEETESFSRISSIIHHHLGFDTPLPQHCVIHLAGITGVGKSTTLKNIVQVALNEGINPAIITYTAMHDFFLSEARSDSQGIISVHFADPTSARIPNQHPHLLNVFKEAITGHSLVIVDEAAIFSFDKDGSLLAELLRERYKNDTPIAVVFVTQFCDIRTKEMYKVSPYLREVLDNPSVMRVVIANTNHFDKE